MMAMARRPRRPAERTDPRAAFLQAVAEYDFARAAYLDDQEDINESEARTDRFNAAISGVLAAVLVLHGQPAHGTGDDSTRARPCSVRHPDGRVFTAGSDHHEPKGGALVLTISQPDDFVDLVEQAPLPSVFREPDSPDVAEAARGAIQSFRHAHETAKTALPSGQSVVDRVTAVRLSRLFNASDELIEALVATDPAVHHDDIAGACKRHWRPRGAAMGDSLFLAVPGNLDEEELAKHADGAASDGGKVTMPLVVRLADIVVL